MTRLDLKTILAILVLSCLLCLNACSTFLPPTLDQKSAPEFIGDTPTFPLKSLDTPTSLPTLTPTTPPEGADAAEVQAAAYPEPGSEAVATEAVVEEAVAAETEAVVEEASAEAAAVETEAVVEEAAAAEATPEPTEAAETTETESAEAAASETTSTEAAGSTEAVSPAPVSLAETLPSADLELPDKYTLQRGEFPYCIARRYNVNPVELMRLNNLYYNQIFHKGLVLWMPQSGKTFGGERALNPHTDVYVVQKDGETINTAACYYGDIDPTALAAANGLALDAILSKGQPIFAAP